MASQSILILPLVGAFIGWLTNKIALWMLYHPHQPRGPQWLALQGLVPRRKDDLANAIAKTVTENLLTQDDLKNMIRNVDLHPYLRDITDSFIDQRLTGTIRGYRFIPQAVRDRLVATIKEAVAERLPARLDDVSPNLTSRIIADLNLGEHLKQRIMDWPMEEVERVTRAVAGREMRGIEIVGALLGFLIGALQALISLL